MPPFLTVSLLRFNFDFEKCERYKETSCYTFPIQINLRPFCEQVCIIIFVKVSTYSSENQYLKDKLSFILHFVRARYLRKFVGFSCVPHSKCIEFQFVSKRPLSNWLEKGIIITYNLIWRFLERKIITWKWKFIFVLSLSDNIIYRFSYICFMPLNLFNFS